MKFSQFEHDFFPHILIPLIGGLFVFGALQSAARAEPASGAKSFVVSASDGYGINDCIKSGEDCAKIVADAWCEAHGHGVAMKFGPAGDITGAIRNISEKHGEPTKLVGEDDVFISCAE
jgi:hypothetical protein